jgi:hypothetical protein
MKDRRTRRFATAGVFLFLISLFMSARPRAEVPMDVSQM